MHPVQSPVPPWGETPPPPPGLGGCLCSALANLFHPSCDIFRFCSITKYFGLRDDSVADTLQQQRDSKSCTLQFSCMLVCFWHISPSFYLPRVFCAAAVALAKACLFKVSLWCSLWFCCWLPWKWAFSLWKRPQVFTITYVVNKSPLPYPHHSHLTKTCCFSCTHNTHLPCFLIRVLQRTETARPRANAEAAPCKTFYVIFLPSRYVFTVMRFQPQPPLVSQLDDSARPWIHFFFVKNAVHVGHAKQWRRATPQSLPHITAFKSSW